MQLFTTRSIRQLVIIGFVTVAALLLVALLLTAQQLERLSLQGQSTVTAVASGMSASRQLIQQTIAMERNARQYAILGEQQLFQLYLNRRAEYFATLEEIARLDVGENTAVLVDELLAQERSAFEVVQQGRNLAGSDSTFPELSRLAYQIASSIEQWISLQQLQLEERSASTQRTLTLQTLLFITAASMFAVVFVLLITRPLRQIDHAINAIGSGEYSKSVSVHGPRDLQVLGMRLEWLRTRLQELEQQRTSFLRHVSHELKTPLASMQEGASLLNDGVVGPLSNEQREISQIIATNCQRLQGLIEDLLRHNAQNFDVLNAMPMKIRFDKIVEQVSHAHALALQSGQLKVVQNLEKVTVTVDPERLRVIVDNLFTNALKFSPLNAVISIELVTHGTNAVMTIHDQGPGVPLQEQEKIFDAFFQGSVPANKQYSGTGLGLAIANDYAKSIGATLSLEASDVGARFRIILPVSA